MDASQINLSILLVSFLLVSSILTSRLAYRIGAPLLLIFLVFGFFVGQDGLGLVFNNAQTAFLIGSVALIIILFESGFQTDLQKNVSAIAPSFVLATAGVALTAVLLAPLAKYFLDLPWKQAFLVSSIVSSTDAAAVFFLLRINKVKIKPLVRSTLEMESSSNDPMAIVLTIVVTEFITHPGSSLSIGFFEIFILQMGIGLVMGLLCSLAILFLINRIRLESSLYPILVPTLAVLVYAMTNSLGGSGFLAAYIAGLLAGNAKLEGDAQLRAFQNVLAWLSQVVMFVTLGLFATPSQFSQVALPALGIGFALMFVIRPAAVFLCLVPFKFTPKEKTFIAFVGLRGSVSILLAIIPLISGIDPDRMIFNTTFLIVLSSLLVQGWGIAPLARLLGLTEATKPNAAERVEITVPGISDFYIARYTVAEDSPVLHGKRLPRWARPLLLKRNDSSFAIQSPRKVSAGDTVYIFVPPSQLEYLDSLFLPDEDSGRHMYFPVPVQTTLHSIAKHYDFKAEKGIQNLSIQDVFAREFETVEVGDRIAVGLIDLIVLEVQEGKVTSAGIDIDPYSNTAFFQPETWLRKFLKRFARTAGRDPLENSSDSSAS